MYPKHQTDKAFVIG